MITVDEVLMGRELEFPLTKRLILNLTVLMGAINYVRGVYDEPLTLSSGYRPARYNKDAGGAKTSPHLTCEAVDVLDSNGRFAHWCLKNQDVLARAGLYMENPDYTKGWVHLQTRKPKSGNRVFTPY